MGDEFTDEMRKWIDVAGYETLLTRLRFAPVGDKLFAGEAGQYYKAALKRRAREIGIVSEAAISQRVGWVTKAAGEGDEDD